MSSNRNAADTSRTTTEVERLEVTGVHDGHPQDGHLTAIAAGAPAERATPSGSPGHGPTPDALPRWQDPRQPVPRRVEDLLARLSLEEKIAQLYGVWVGGNSTGDDLAPHQHEMVSEAPDWRDLISAGLGQLTRPFGTAPVDPALGARALARMQEEIVAANRFGIPAIAHEECLTGFMTWQATVYPTPLAWGATFDPALVERMAAQIGSTMKGIGVHQGLAPVLDVIRDLRWGRCEESIGEDPYLVATIGTAYVRGLQSAGVIATLKHFVGYSASRAGRNFGPVGVGPRELADVLLPPFEMAIRDGGAGSVMHAYTEIDGMPPAADPDLLTGLLRERWDFSGTVVADYFGISFLQRLHSVAADLGEAATLAISAGVDVELPAAHCYGAPLLDAVRGGTVPESLIDRAATRVLRQKCELGLLDGGWSALPGALAGTAEQANGDAPGTGEGSIDLDPPASRALARELAEESVVLVANSGALPLRPDARIALVGPLADNVAGMLGCYTFPGHVGTQHPELPDGVEIPTLLAALRSELPETPIKYAPGGTVDGSADADAIRTAATVAAEADVCVAVLGDRAGLFGNGTSGEGCDVPDLRLPGAQADLLDALIRTDTPVVLVLLSGRPYALGGWVDRLAGVVQAFFPGEEGGPAVARVLSGAVCPSGRLPVSLPRDPGGQPGTYLSPALGRRTEVSSVDPTPLFPFGHGLSYTEFTWPGVRVDGVAPADRPVEVGTDGEVTVSVTVRNDGPRSGAEVVQLYLHDPVAQVTRPVVRLIGYARVSLGPGESAEVDFRVHADLSSFTGRRGYRVVEPGDLELRLSASSAEHRHTVPVRLVGPERQVDLDRRLTAEVTIR